MVLVLVLDHRPLQTRSEVIIGDAAMHPFELMAPRGNINPRLESETRGVDWLNRIQNHFERAVWINPEPLGRWRMTRTTNVIRSIFPMFELTVDGIEEANVFGVLVPNAEGRAGMVAVVATDRFDLKDFERFVAEKLPGYQRPRFVRIVGGHMNITGTFKHQKVEYRKQGFDPSAIDDALFALVDGTYVPLDAEMFAKIESGEIEIA